MSAFNPEVKRALQELSGLDRQIEEMHRRVYNYLLDRSKFPHPRHEELISRIMHYRIKGIRSRELELRLDNLQHKTANRSKIWKQWFEDDGKGHFLKGKMDSSTIEPQKESDPLLEKVFERTQETWAKNGVDGTESREEFMERILPDYQEAQSGLKKGQKIIFTYDKKSSKAQMKIKEE
jgi:hypothetical protein